MLEPYRILDFTDDRGELASMLLGDLGADVIRVEPPGGSDARRSGPTMEAGAEDLCSLQFVAYNRNKRSIVLDPNSAADLEVLRELVRGADFVFESSPGRALAEYGFDFEDLERENPRIVCTRISPFGEGGPYVGLQGNDLVIAAMGGPVSLQGPADRAPVRVSVPQVWRHAGAEAASAALAAHARMLKTGRAQFVDLSAQATMTWTMMHAMEAYAIRGKDFERNGSATAMGQLTFDVVYPCRDGHVVVLSNSRVFLGFMDDMIEKGVLDESDREADWSQLDGRLGFRDAKPYNMDALRPRLAKWVAHYTKQELLDLGIARDVTLAPCETVKELLAFEQLDTREYWHALELPSGHTVRAPGAWAKVQASPLSFSRPAPSLDEHGDEIRSELRTGLVRSRLTDSNVPPTERETLPFAGLKVADFSWFIVGPLSVKYLADHGASVVRVESEGRPDFLRGLGPFKDNKPGWNRSQNYADFNTSKKSLTLAMKNPEARAIAKRLASWADVLVESFTPGTIGRMGLDYETLREFNPSIIMLSTCLMGQTGPCAQFAGYGYHAGAMAGFYEVTGWPDRPPSGPWSAYTDAVAPRFIQTILAAAIDHRRRTGEGQYIDLAQIESALYFLAPEILECQSNGHVAMRNGNRARDAAPQGCYPCAGDDQWCAIAVDTDAQWRALRKEIGDPDWVRDSALDSTAGRLAAHDLIDEKLADWTRDQIPGAVMQRLQLVGVPAGVVQRSRDLLEDPQYNERGFYRYLDHSEVGTVPYAGHQYKIRGYDNAPRSAAPCLGQHNHEVLSELLGMSDDEIADALASGAVA